MADAIVPPLIGAAASTRTDLGDISAQEFTEAMAEAAGWIVRYLEGPERPDVSVARVPGILRDALPAAPPKDGQPLADTFAAFRELIVPHLTHWNHPRFFGYFSISGSMPGIVAELLTAAVNVNAMLWHASPAATELEEVTVDWLRQAIGLPASFRGFINEGGSISNFYALAAARHAVAPWVRREGFRDPARPALRVYCSADAHSSIDKAALALGLGLDGVRRIPLNDAGAIRLDALRLAISEDDSRGQRPMAVVATVGTTSTGAIDEVEAVADICREFGVWLHVDASYGGAAAIVPEARWILGGTASADSLVINPHKWLFVPLDCSVLLSRRLEIFKKAFSLVPDYLETSDSGVNFMDYSLTLGRRFRALKLWAVMRSFGTDGLAARIREHMRLAGLLAEWIRTDRDFELLASRPLSVVCFRHVPAGEPLPPDQLNAHNRRLLERINGSGHLFLSHTLLEGRFALRIAIGNIRTTEAELRAAWKAVRRVARQTRP